MVIGTTCDSCNEPTIKNAKFCHNCGKSIGNAPEQSMSGITMIMFMGLIVVVSISFTFGLKLYLDGRNEVASITPFPSRSNVPNENRQPSQLPDLSTMTPREAADRLFNRVMSASETGDQEEAKRFAPMAAQAYIRVKNIDLDGLFHLGLIYLVREDFQNAIEQVVKIRNSSPDHLLGTLLEHTVAERTSDKPRQMLASTKFLRTYQNEMNSGRPEYSAHKNSIEKLRSKLMLTGGKFRSPVANVSLDQGQGVFIKNCSICHGKNASGTKNGPPLVHKLYEPSHHDNDSFYQAVQNGVQAHHWSFGDMPPMAGVKRQEVQSIIKYVRGLQIAKDIR